ncbi:tripartite tricarboxylate transporter TctB family protein [Cobetia marina]|uniref:tripartite tricarboxylate transporter TctB family protein n=1 Tax=Cobetia marina TaxID=28258 RepID=UPI00174B77AF
MRTNDKVTGVVTAAFGAAVIYASLDLKNLPRQEYGAGTFPTVIGALLILFGAILLVRGLRNREVWFAWQHPVPLVTFIMTLAAICASIVAYIYLTPIVGFPVVSFVLLALLLYTFHHRRWLPAGGIALVATGVIWEVFGQLLHVPLELGLLEKVIY